MDLQNRRVTRSTAGVANENLVGTRKAKDVISLMQPRRAFVDQRNTRSALPKNIVKENVVKPVRRPSPVFHPEITGIEREFSAVDFMDDVYLYLLAKEPEFQPSADFLTNSSVTPKMRAILIDWLVQVHLRFHLLPETLHLTVYLIDCVIGSMKIEKSDLQLVGVACMLVAAKFEEMYVPDVTDFEYITDNAFTRRQIIKMELKVLHSCNYILSRPHSITILRWLSKELGVASRQHAVAKYLGEVALIDHTLLGFLPSQVAAMSICLSFRMASIPFDSTKMLTMIGWNNEEMTAGTKLLGQALLRLHSHEKLQALRVKFSSPKQSGAGNFSEQELQELKQL